MGWTGGVWCRIFFSHGFQLAFAFKTVFKALDHDLHFVQYMLYMGQHAHFLCARDRVQTPLAINFALANNTMDPIGQNLEVTS